MELVQPRRRLSAADTLEFSPWVGAPLIEDCHIFWLPVSCFPLLLGERIWLLDFIQRFSRLLQEQEQLREEVFLQFAVASSTYAESFQRYSMKAQMLPGISRHPGEALRGKAEMEEAKREIEETGKFDFSKWTSDYAVWFQHKRAEEQRQLFFGGGGMTLLFSAPDPKTVPPPLPFSDRFRKAMPVMQLIDVDAMVAGAFALNDRFLPQSKKVFGADLQDLDAAGFVLPLFDARHFVDASAEDRAAWFQVFDVYLREAPADSGVVLAFHKDYREILAETLRQMAEEGSEYPLKREHV